MAFGSSLDQISPFAHSCSDLYEILRIAGGFDERDATSSIIPLPDPASLDYPDRPLRVGLLRNFLEHDALDDAVSLAAQGAIRLCASGQILVDIELPSAKYSIPVYYIVATAEASSNLARFDGVRYGFRHPEATDLAAVYDMSRGAGFGPEVRRRIMMGTYVLSSGYYDAYYNTALKVRHVIADEIAMAMKDVDVILAPTTPSTAFKIGEKVDDPVAMYLSDVFTVPANLAGVPAVSIPWSTDAAGLPIGLQLMGRHYAEAQLLSAGILLEKLRPQA
ncbi:MAG: hypothetical protein IPG71_11670 [bacterium]|nr:hypothetical protein [bacterium]